MRLSVADDPVASRRALAYCDGVLLRGCYLANEEAGLALCYETNEDGRIARDADGSPRRREVRGRIEIRRKE